MKLTPLTAVLSAILTAPVFTAPAPEPLEIAISIDDLDHVASKQAQIPPAKAVFHGATPSALFDLSVPVSGKTFPINNKLSISYITLQGFAGCIFFGVDGSKTLAKSYGIPQTVPVGPPQTQVNGSCVDPNRILELLKL